MLEQLQSELQAIKDQMAQMNREHPREAAQYDRLKEQADKLEKQIEALNQSAQERAVIVEQAKTDIATAFDAIEFEGETYTIEAFAQNGVAATALRNFFTSRIAAQAEAFSQQIAEIKAEHSREIEEQKSLVQSLKEQLAQAILDKEDAEAKRDAAVREAESARAEAAGMEILVSEKQKQIDKMREENALGAVGALKVITNTDSDALRETMEAWKKSRPAIYDVQPLDSKRSRFSAKLAETDEPIEFGHLERGKYRELSEEEAARFRQELEAAKAAEPVAPAVESDLAVDQPTIEAVQFQAPDLPGTGDNAVHGEVVQEATLEERVAKLEAAVFGKVTEEAA